MRYQFAALVLCLAALVASVLSGCAATVGYTSPAPVWLDTYTVTIDPDFSPAQTEAIGAAVDEWRAAVPATLTVEIGTCDVPTEGQLCIKPTSLAAVMDQQDTDNAVAHSTWWYTWGLTYLSTDEAPEHWTETAAHELGHDMGLSHTGAGSVMCATLSCAAPGVTSVDAAQWVSLRKGQ